ncbi:phospholipase C [Pararobbsia alpina]|uniref:Non-hemolytic phospholipase C n=1 Tax=Pararobbsia alpina TaxID=621374 RepID=A0A6S7BMM4_9BURK|nr:alkaline phosphatase family protein [Pararobbsia alpina]CAB3806215.1 Non-hemolytic phospholipase C [Pararobbsia alpina]
MFRRALLPIPFAAALLVLSACGSSTNPAATPAATPAVSAQDALPTATPIKHLVVIYGENRSFDHYFGTYPVATNPPGEPVFTAAANTPTVDGLTTALLTNNPNATGAANVTKATAMGFPTTDMNPFRIDRQQANTADQNHAYTPEQLAEDNGAMDAFVANTGTASAGGSNAFGTVAQVMGYFDGNTVTGYWNYAQNYAMSDNAYTDSFGPSTPGALAVVSGTTNGAVAVVGTANTIPDNAGGLTLINDTDPAYDVCSSKTSTVKMTSKNIGDLLNAANITWGSFMGGFDLTAQNANASVTCGRSTYSATLNTSPTDYVPHHNWFQYYASTSNYSHARPSSPTTIGFSKLADGVTPEPANHEYDYNDFVTAVKAGNYPSVSYIKAPAVGDGHPGNSDPIDEQEFVVNLVNFIQQQPDWKSTAVIVTYDDSDGWYDHKFAQPTTSSADAVTVETINGPTSTVNSTIAGADQVSGPGTCTSASAKPGVGITLSPVNGRCGPGTRIPFIVISPWVTPNTVSHVQITQSSVVRFIEDNWLGGTRIGQGSNDANAGDIRALFNFTGNTGPASTLFLDPTLGTKLSAPPAQS